MLFRGNAEADIRRALVRKGYIKGIIGLPPNLFYGTGIPACIVVIDKEDAQARKGIFMIDASGGFMKDGPKNRLRAQDIHRIVDAFNRRLEVPKYARMVSFEEIEKNDFNLNLPRYIDSQTPEDLQDIEGHLKGGIPAADIDALQRYWDVCPQLRHDAVQGQPPRLRRSRRGEVGDQVRHLRAPRVHRVHRRHERAFRRVAADERRHAQGLAGRLPSQGGHRRAGRGSARPLRRQAAHRPLRRLSAPDGLLGGDDAGRRAISIAADGWKAETTRIIEKDKKGKEKDKGWTCDLIPKPLIVARYFAKEQAAIDQLAAELEGVTARLTEMEEEHSGEDGAFAELDRVTKARVSARLSEIDGDNDASDEFAVLNDWAEAEG